VGENMRWKKKRRIMVRPWGGSKRPREENVKENKILKQEEK
jgi:hypothetical protein